VAASLVDDLIFALGEVVLDRLRQDVLRVDLPTVVSNRGEVVRIEVSKEEDVVGCLLTSTEFRGRSLPTNGASAVLAKLWKMTTRLVYVL
jgi:hypothetical protein